MSDPRLFLRVSVLLGGLATAMPGQIVTAASNAPPQIIVSGSGEAHVVPDRATVYVGIRTRAGTAAAAASENAKKQRAILDTLRAVGLTSDQLTTSNYSVSPETKYDNATQTTRVTGYTVTNSVVANVRRIDEVGTVIDAALAKGANEISGLQFYSSAVDSARKAALADAVAKARGDAEVLARAAGGSLGPLLELSTQAPIRPMYETAFRSTAMAAQVPTPIEPGQETIAASVTARWAFVSGVR